MFFIGVDDKPIKMEIIAEHMNYHLRMKFYNSSFQHFEDSEFMKRRKRRFLYRKMLTTKAVNTEKSHFEINSHASIAMLRENIWDNEIFLVPGAELLSFHNIEKNGVEIQWFPGDVCKTSRHWGPPAWGSY